MVFSGKNSRSVDYTMCWYVPVSCMMLTKGVTHHSGRAQSKIICDDSVCGHPSSGDLTHHVIDIFIIAFHSISKRFASKYRSQKRRVGEGSSSRRAMERR